MGRRRFNQNFFVGLFGITFSLVLLGVWIPKDIDTGVIDVWRRNVRIGDAMLPTFAAIGMLIASLPIILRALFSDAQGIPRQIGPGIVYIITAIALSLALMRFCGPIAVSAWFGPEGSYRLLIDTMPWKYIGFFSGGSAMVFSLICLAEQRWSGRSLAIALVTTALIAAAYDLPFDNLFLPPNADF